MNQYSARERQGKSFVRTLLIRNPHRTMVAFALLALVPTSATAQYPGGGSSPSYGSKGAVIGGVAAGVAVGAGLLYWKLHHRAKLQGCLEDDGDKLVTDLDNQTYTLTNKQNQSLKPGQRVEVLGKKAKNAAGEPTFEVYKMSKNLGQCTATTAEQR